ncbi:MAG: hypothetical protein HFE90_07905 [Firmicutes bacterium]|nr:hypothetical protein [Bacillota bacterium]
MKRKSKRIIPIILSWIMLFSGSAVFVSADESTTTMQTAYKNLDPMTEIYAVTSTPGSDYKYYGAKWEPDKGVYYGRISLGGQTPNGQYGIVNKSQIMGESVLSIYHELNSQYKLQDFYYMFEPIIEDGKHALLVNLNYTNEGSDCAAIINGSYDSRITADLQYIATLKCPVFLRIGGEVNVWTNMPNTESYKQSFRHIASLTRNYAPNAAIVFSPNFSSGYKVDIDSFYPGDNYVDWVGTSLYYNKYSGAANADPKFVGVGEFGDPMLNIQQTINLSNLHSKPVIITEGGSFHSYRGEDTSQFARERVKKAYSFLTMVYPQIKCMVYSDSDFGSASEKYTIYNHSAMSRAYSEAVSANPTLADSCSNPNASYYTKLSAMSANWEGTVTLSAYSYASSQLTAAWYIDDQWYANASNYPFTCTINTNSLKTGSHRITVKFSNGASKSYNFNIGSASAIPTNDSLYVDNIQKSPEIYKINGTNYFKLRDVAVLLNNTDKQFSVDYDNTSKQITLNSGKQYIPTGTELQKPSGNSSAQASASNNNLIVNGKKIEPKAYKINGNNYIKLRDLGQALDFYVGYENGKVIIESNHGYSA